VTYFLIYIFFIELLRKGREGSSLEDADFIIKEVKIEEMKQKKKLQKISATTG
jgi:hypothetical protein